MSVVEQTFESATLGAITGTNPPAPIYNARSATGTGSLTVVSPGLLGGKCQQSAQTSTAASDAYGRFDSVGAGTGPVAFRFYFSTDTAINVANQLIARLQDTAGTRWGVIRINGSGKLQLTLQSTDVLAWTAASALSINTNYRIEIFANGLGASKTVKIAYYVGNSSTPVEEWSSSTANTGSATNTDQIRVGKIGGTQVSAFKYDNVAYEAGGSDYIGPASVNPTANAGVDQSGVDAGATVNLNGSGSSAVSPAVISSYSWTQTAGSTVVLTGATTATPSFTAPSTPGGETLTFALTVTDSNGLSSAVDSVNVGVLAPAAGGTLVDQTFEAAALGDVTSSNPTARNFDARSGTGTGHLRIVSSNPMHGTKCMESSQDDTTSSDAYGRWSALGQFSSGVCRTMFRINAFPSSGRQQCHRADDNAGNRFLTVSVDSNGHLVLQLGTADTVVWTGTVTLPLDRWIRFEWRVGALSTTNAVVKFDYYLEDSLTPMETGYSTTTGNTGPAANIDQIRWGRASSTVFNTQGFDSLAFKDNTATYLGPPTAITPTADAGEDIVNVEPWSTVNLDGAGSYGSNQMTYAWSQTAGTAVVLSDVTSITPTFVAPASVTGETLTFQLIVTNSSEMSSDPDTVNVTILPVTERAVMGGVEKPMRMLAVAS